MKHFQPHFYKGLCECDCERCHLPLTGLCVCEECECDSEEDHEYWELVKRLNSDSK